MDRANLAIAFAASLAATILVGFGVLMLSFEWHKAQAGDVLARAPAGYWRDLHPDFAREADGLRETMGLFAALPVTGAPARHLRFALTDPSGDPAAREAAITAILSHEPAAGAIWFQRARQLLAAGAPLEDVFPALEASRVTAPLEGDVLIERAAFVLALWERAPESARRGAVLDITAFGAALGHDHYAPFKRLARTVPQTVRDDIWSRLQGRLPAGRSGWSWILGLP